MKILFLTDTHIRGTNPSSRKDNFADSLEEKFIELSSIIKEEGIDFVLHGGDLFDRPDLSISTINRFVRILKSIEVPMYLISGNHDIYGHNPMTIGRTILSLLSIMDLLTVIEPGENYILEKDKLRVQLTGQPYVYDIDRSDKALQYYSPKTRLESIDYSIHMVHGLLMDKPFIDGIPWTLIDDIKETKADITLSGHYHSGFKTIDVDGKFFINPGAMARVSNTKAEIIRKPKVVIIEIEKNRIDIKDVFLKSAKSGSEVIDREKIEASIFQNEKILEFKEGIERAVNFEKLDINDVLLEVSNAENVDSSVKKEALRRITEIQMEKFNGD